VVSPFTVRLPRTVKFAPFTLTADCRDDVYVFKLSVANSIEFNLFLADDAEFTNELALTDDKLADINKLLLTLFKDVIVELTLAVNVFNDDVVSCNEFVTELTLALNVFKAVIEDACEVLVEKAVDADVLKELALTTKLLALTSKLFISLSEDVVYAVKELAVTCKAENETNADAVNVFNALILVEAPQLPEPDSIASSLVS
jgi:hypothetical protein